MSCSLPRVVPQDEPSLPVFMRTFLDDLVAEPAPLVRFEPIDTEGTPRTPTVDGAMVVLAERHVAMYLTKHPGPHGIGELEQVPHRYVPRRFRHGNHPLMTTPDF